MADAPVKTESNAESGASAPTAAPAPTPAVDHVAPSAEVPVTEISQADIDALMTAAAAGGDDVTSAENALAPAEATAATVETPPSPAPPEATTPQVQGFELPQFSAAASAVDPKRISMLSDVNLNVKIELGRTRMLVEDVLKLGEGSVVELDKLAGDPVDVYANDRLVARGEVLVLNDSFCVRINEVVSGDPHRVTV